MKAADAMASKRQDDVMLMQLRAEIARKLEIPQGNSFASQEAGAAAGCKRGPVRRLALDHGAIDAVLGGGLMLAALHEIRAEEARDLAVATGFLLALLAMLNSGLGQQDKQGQQGQGGKIVWVGDPAGSVENMGLYPSGFLPFGLGGEQFLLVSPEQMKTALWAIDEAARCGQLVASVFQVRGNPSALSMTATRRLMLRAGQSGSPCFILRHSGGEEASAAETRWCVKPVSGKERRSAEGSAHDVSGEWQMRHVLSLERNRSGQTGQWVVAFNSKKKSFEHVANAKGKSRKGTAGTTTAI